MTEPNHPSPEVSPRFDVQWRFGGITDTLRKQLVAFWTREGAITGPDEAWRRSGEVACILQDTETGSIAGVCTVAIRLDEHGRSYGFLRIFIGVGNRRMALKVRLLQHTINGFLALASEPGAPHRLVASIENRNIERHGGRRLLAKLGFVFMGTAPNGEHIIQRELTA
jgi:hypothetical protein